ncbi:hypothetical protein GCM10023321_44470 [Pseudonocardia eucalypti]|uniref:Transglycosylase SLT domain-containing protein n=1 Tax=Pseudonocardia eucalypti TaxID=648755 RepID=A0ABP9QFC4_9PSEU|nr:hypothetical protein [Pseudonocardia eucalypti]
MWFRGVGVIAVAMVALLGLLVIVAAEDRGAALTGVDPAKLPELAKQMLPVIDEVVRRDCPELPPVWVVAEIMAESGWNAKARSSDSNGGAFGLYQINNRNWAAAGGEPGSGDIFIPETHLRLGIPWVCANLRAVTGHLRDTGKPTAPLDAMLVCHIAGCGRVTGSATGVPAPGEAGCGDTCVGLVNRYLRNVHRYVAEFAAPPPGPAGPATPPPPGPAPDVLAAGEAGGTGRTPGSAPDGYGAGPTPVARAAPLGLTTLGGVTTAALPPAPAGFTGRSTGCAEPDPTSSGCLTAAAVHGLRAQAAAFGPLGKISCWDRHEWNPGSDHARGRACDLFPGPPGEFAEGDRLEQGWRVANWFRANAAALRVKYLIWQGRFWDPGAPDEGGWGERYDGGGVYDVRNPTGGHYDHVHVSFAE